MLYRYDSETGDAAFVDAGLVALPPQVTAAGAGVKLLNLSENSLKCVEAPTVYTAHTLHKMTTLQVLGRL